MLFATYKQSSQMVGPQRWVEFGDFGCLIVRDREAGVVSQQKSLSFTANPACRMILAVFPGAVESLQKACEENREKFEEAFPLTVSFVEQKTTTVLQTNKAKVRVLTTSRLGVLISSADFEFEESEVSLHVRLLFAWIRKEFNSNRSNSFAFKFGRSFFMVEVCTARQERQNSDYAYGELFLNCYIYPYPATKIETTSENQPMCTFSKLIHATLLVSNSGKAEFKISPWTNDYKGTAEKQTLPEQKSLKALANLVCQTCRFCRELGVPAPKKCTECVTCAKYI
jgi:hypothetical protein